MKICIDEEIAEKYLSKERTKELMKEAKEKGFTTGAEVIINKMVSIGLLKNR
jgi:hypothetical protein